MTSAINLKDLPLLNLGLIKSHDECTQAQLDWLAQHEGITLTGPEDPAWRVVRSTAYREMLLRYEIDQAAKQLTLAHAKGAALDHIGITYHRTPRKQDELDDIYRERIALSPEGVSVAGPKNAYIYHGLSAHNDIKDVAFFSPLPNDVELTILSKIADGTASNNLLTAVKNAVNAERVRAQGDRVIAKSAEILTYTIVAHLILNDGFNQLTVISQAQEAASEYVTKQHMLGSRVVESAVHHALHVAGVKEVQLDNWQDVIANDTQAPFCANIEVTA